MSTDLDVTAGLSTAPVPLPRVETRGRGRRRRSPWVVLRRGWRQLTSMRTALLLLFLLALGAVPGSWLPQRGLNSVEVTGYFVKHPTLAPLLDKLYLFDVFSSPWFAAIYLLLFVSLVGCLSARLRLHARALVTPPPPAPRLLARLPESASYVVDADQQQVLAAVRHLLRRRRWRVAARTPDTLSAEKGYLRETGNLCFHVCIVVLLVGIAIGGLFGYKGSVLLVEGDGGFSNTLISYDNFKPGRLFTPSQLAPFSLALTGFRATYVDTGVPKTFDAQVAYRSRPDAPLRHDDVRVNHPLVVGGTKVYLLGHGYAPRFTVVDATGHTVFEQAVACLPQDTVFTSTCTLKVPATTPSANGTPTQLGFTGFFFPTTVRRPNQPIASAFPADRNPGVTLLAWRGDLGLDSGIPQSVYRLDTTHMSRIGTKFLAPGDTWKLPGGGSIAFTGVSQWATFQVAHQPGNDIALLAAVGIVGGLVLSLRIRRRRLWVRVSNRAGASARASAAASATSSAEAAPTKAQPVSDDETPTRTLVEVGGLARSDGDAFAQEFAGLLAALRQPEV